MGKNVCVVLLLENSWILPLGSSGVGSDIKVHVILHISTEVSPAAVTYNAGL